MKRFRLIILLTLFFGVSKINAQLTNLKFPDDYNETPIDVLEDVYWMNNYATFNLKLRKDCGKIIVNESKYIRPQTFWFVESEHGTLFGSDGGEWVGGFYSKPSKGAPVKLRNINVKFLQIDKGDVLLFEVDNNYKKSTFHFVYRDEESSMLELRQLADLSDIPTYTFHNDKGEMYVMGRKNVYKYEVGRFVALFAENIWKNIIPNDVIQKDDETFIIAVEGGIIEAKLKDKKIRLFTRKIK